jgi:predicted nucleotidyltransferase
MTPSNALRHHREALRALVRAHGLKNPRVFGSVARASDGADSDLDLLVDPTPDVTTYFDLAAFQADAERILGVRVDVRTPAALHASIRAAVLSETVPL